MAGVLDDEGHVAVGDADVLAEEDPGVLPVVEPVSVVRADHLGLAEALVLVVEGLDAEEALELDSLVRDYGDVLLSDVSRALRIPKELGELGDVVEAELFVLADVPGDSRARLAGVDSDEDHDPLAAAPCLYLEDLSLVGAFEGLTEIGLAAQIQLQFLEDYPAWFLLRE